MKKNLFRMATMFSAVALLGVVSCQKEESPVLFTASIESAVQQSKTTISFNQSMETGDWSGNVMWESGDAIAVYGSGSAAASTLVTSSTGATAEFVLQEGSAELGGGPYYAIYPAGLAEGAGSIALPEVQECGGSHVAAPMYAYTENDHLAFKNLCSLLELNLTAGKTMKSIEVTTPNNVISGTGFGVAYNNGNPTLSIPATGGHHVTLDCGAGVDCTNGATFYLYLPPAEYTAMTITFIATDGSSRTLRLNNANDATLEMERNYCEYLNLGSVNFYAPAQLVVGMQFNNQIPSNATAVVFEYNSAVSSGTQLNLSGTSTPIYGNLNGTVWTVSTPAASILANNSCFRMFANKSNLTQISFGDGFNTSNVEIMNAMFNGCTSLTSLDLSGFNTERVRYMDYMFQGCSSLSSLNLSGFNTGSVTTMDNMFSGCSSLSSIDLSGFNTAHVESFSEMFKSCSSLTSLDLSSFDASQVTSIGGMFQNCTSLETLTLPSDFSAPNVTYIDNMFRNCSSLTSIDLSNFYTPYIVQAQQVFNGCVSLESLDISQLNMDNVSETEATFMFMNAGSSSNSGHLDITCTQATHDKIVDRHYGCFLDATIVRWHIVSGSSEN